MYQYKSTITTVIMVLFLALDKEQVGRLPSVLSIAGAQWMFVVKTGKLSRYFIYSNFSTNMLVHFYPKNLQSLWTFILSYTIHMSYLCTTEQSRAYISISSSRLCNLNFLSRSECDFYWLLRLFEVWPTSNIKTLFLWCYGPSNVSQVSSVNTDWAIKVNI